MTGNSVGHSDEWSKQSGFLTVKMTGSAVRSGAILVQDLEAALGGFRTSLERLAQRKIEGVPLPRRGPRHHEVKARVRLFFRAYQAGSAIVKLELRPEQLELSAGLPGAEIVSEWMQGAAALREPSQHIPDSFDDAVLSGLQMLDPLLNKGIDGFEFVWEVGGHTTRTTYDSPASNRVKTLLQKPAQNRHTISGFILSADFLSPDVKFTVFTDDGRPVACATSPDRLGVVLEGIMHHVRVSGDADFHPGTGVVRSIRVDSIEVDRSSELTDRALPYEDIRDFWMGTSIDEMIRRQQVSPIPVGDAPDWTPPSDADWDRYESVLRSKKRPRLPEGE